MPDKQTPPTSVLERFHVNNRDPRLRHEYFDREHLIKKDPYDNTNMLSPISNFTNNDILNNDEDQSEPTTFNAINNQLHSSSIIDIDPRKRAIALSQNMDVSPLNNDNIPLVSSTSASDSIIITPSQYLQYYLQKSYWYTSLSSSNKMATNNIIAYLAKCIKSYQVTRNKLFCLTNFYGYEKIEEVLNNLKIKIDETGEIIEINNQKEYVTKIDTDNSVMIHHWSEIVYSHQYDL